MCSRYFRNSCAAEYSIDFIWNHDANFNWGFIYCRNWSFIAEDEVINSKKVVERFDISDKVEIKEVVEEDPSEDWYKSEEE